MLSTSSATQTVNCTIIKTGIVLYHFEETGRFLQLFVQIIGGGLAALGSILLRETGDYDAMTPRDIVIPATAVLCFGVVLAFIALFGAYGASCFQAKDCLIVVRSKQKFCIFSKYLSNYTPQFTQGTKHDF